MKISLTLILDTVFYLLAGFTLSLIVVNYFLAQPASYVLAATFAIIFTIFAVKISINKKSKKFSSKEKEKRYNSVMTLLNLSGEKTAAELFEKALKKEGFSTEKKKGRRVYNRKKHNGVFLFPLRRR